MTIFIYFLFLAKLKKLLKNALKQYGKKIKFFD